MVGWKRDHIGQAHSTTIVKGGAAKLLLIGGHEKYPHFRVKMGSNILLWGNLFCINLCYYNHKKILSANLITSA